MFPEADPSCYKDASKLYYGGKKLIYYDDSLPETSIESVFRNYTYYTRKKYKDNHYKEHIRGFSKKTGIALTEKGYGRIPETCRFPGEKYIIVSATADKEICEWYFGKGNVDFYECKQAEYMGELKQYCGKSMSRTCLANNPGMVALERMHSASFF